MQRSVWTRPALQQSEAVMMPALQRRRVGEPQFSDPYNRTHSAENPFRPIENEQMTTALSTYVRPRGSIAGRSVLRAVGVMLSPWMGTGRPSYYQSLMGRRLMHQGFYR